MQFEAKLLQSYIKELILEEMSAKKLRVFDFDDTLVTTDAMVHVTNASGEKFDLTPGEFAVYDQAPGDTFDYSDFEQLINPRSITWTGKILKKIYAKYGPAGVVILSARTTSAPIKKFLDDAGFAGIRIVALGSSDPEAKAAWIDNEIVTQGLDLVEFFDDSHKNIAAVKRLTKDHKDVKIIARHIVHKFMKKEKKLVKNV